MISMTYGQQCETLRFVWRNESFRLRCFWPRRGPKRNGSRPSTPGWRQWRRWPGAVDAQGAKEGAQLASHAYRPRPEAPRSGLEARSGKRRSDVSSPSSVSPVSIIPRGPCPRQRRLRMRPVDGIVQFEGQPGSSEVAQKSTQAVETIGARKLVRDAERASFKSKQ
jgi:hypothetical protein